MIDTVILQGKEVIQSLDQLAELRMEIFRAYPYFYEGNAAEEKKYLQAYAHSAESFFVVCRVAGKITGMVSGLPLRDARREVWTTPSPLSIERIFYLGEILVLEEYRGSGLGKILYERFEQAVKARGIYEKIAFKEIVLTPGDPRRPETYVSLDSFWEQRGYVKHPELRQQMAWPESGGKEVVHTLVFWIKELSCSP